MDITPAQSRAARGLLDWSQTELGARSNLSESTIRDFEKGRRIPSPNNLAAIRSALEAAGVEFTNGGRPGVRVRGDKAYGYLHDEQGIVGLIKDGELRSGRDGKVIALVKDGRLHDPETGAFISRLGQLGVFGNPLPKELRSKLKK